MKKMLWAFGHVIVVPAVLCLFLMMFGSLFLYIGEGGLRPLILAVLMPVGISLLVAIHRYHVIVEPTLKGKRIEVKERCEQGSAKDTDSF